MAGCKGPLAKTALYRVEPAAQHRVRHIGPVGSDGALLKEDCRASRKARRRLTSPAHRRALRCMLGI